MKLFISWSGVRGRLVAEALSDWLPRIIQAVKPFYSPHIEKGAQWGGEIDEALEGTSFGIVCLTRDNLNSRWIHYEAGALAKTQGARIWTFLLDLRPSDVGQPLGRFQATVAEMEDVLRLARAINSRLSDVGQEPLSSRLLEDNVAAFWPQLEERLRSAATAAEDQQDEEEPQEVRNERAVLDEILSLIRSQERRLEYIEARIKSPRTTAKKVRQRREGTVPTEIEQVEEKSKEPIVCKECGAINEPYAWYCEICGTGL
jgi:hypothetical protein